MNTRRTLLNSLKTRPIAHRGLFDNSKDAPENTLLAFKRAAEAGYGIELDVQLSRDKQVVVTHDYNLERLCGVNKAVADMDYGEISRCNVFSSEEKIPLLADVLRAVDGKVPIIIDIKPEKEYEDVCECTAKALKGYEGMYCIESFSPYVVRWFKKNHPDVVRGQLAEDFLHTKFFKSRTLNWALTNMVFNIVSRPDFVAYNYHSKYRKSLAFWKIVLRCSLVAWTIKTQEEFDRAAKRFDVIIFDSFIPLPAE